MTVKWQLPTAPIISSYPAGVFENKARVGLIGVEKTKAKSRLRETAVADAQTGQTILYQAQPQVLPLAETRIFYPSAEVLTQSIPPSVTRVRPEERVSVAAGTSDSILDGIISPVVSPTLSSETVAQAALAKAIAKRKTENPEIFDKHAQPSIWKAALRNTLLGIMVAAFVLMASIVVPELYYRFVPENVAEVATLPPAQVSQLTQPVEPAVVEVRDPEPVLDPTLPEGTWLIIPTIGVHTQLKDTLDPNEALDQGAWLVPDFGRPNDTSLPIIAAAHRFGWDWWWQSDFGTKNSFYSLPSLKSGDTVEIVFNQRKYVYRIYSDVIEDTEITDYQADLILYTCKFLNSPERFFVYANRDTTAEVSQAPQIVSDI